MASAVHLTVQRRLTISMLLRTRRRKTPKSRCLVVRIRALTVDSKRDTACLGRNSRLETVYLERVSEVEVSCTRAPTSCKVSQWTPLIWWASARKPHPSNRKTFASLNLKSSRCAQITACAGRLTMRHIQSFAWPSASTCLTSMWGRALPSSQTSHLPIISSLEYSSII